MTFDIVNPEALGRPSGWSHGMVAPAGGRVVFIAGQTAADSEDRVPDIGFVEQFGRALDRVLAVLAECGGWPTDVGRMTIYVTDLDAYRESREALGETWRDRMGRHYPAMALVEVTRLVDTNAMVEIEATAVLTDSGAEEE